MEDSIYAIVLALIANMTGPSGANELPATEASNVPVQRARPLPSDRQPSGAGNPESVPGESLGSLFSWDDYPEVALQKDEQGTVGVTLTVGTDGKVTDCVVNLSSGSPSLDVQTCRLLWARARFTPARDAQGKPVQDTYTQRIRWELPEPDILEVAEQFARHIFTVDSKNSITGCRYEASSAWRDSICPELIKIIQDSISTVPDGVPLAGSELVVEIQQRIGDYRGGIELGERAGEHSFSFSRINLTIDALGMIKSCSRDSSVIAQMYPDQLTCDVLQRSRFEALPAKETNKNDRHLTLIIAFYLRKPTDNAQQSQPR